MVFGVKQPQRKNCCTRASQPMKELCMGLGGLLIKDMCVGVKQLLADGCYAMELDNSQ